MLNHAMRYVIIIIGCLLAAAAYNLFLIPMNFLSGGLAGIAFILYYLFNLPIGIMNFLLNIPILYIARIVLVKIFTCKKSSTRVHF